MVDVKGIPSKFTKKYLLEENSATATLTLMGLRNHVWHVGIVHMGNEKYFGAGWKKFVKDVRNGQPSLELVVLYEGNMGFTITRFTHSGSMMVDLPMLPSGHAAVSVGHLEDLEAAFLYHMAEEPEEEVVRKKTLSNKLVSIDLKLKYPNCNEIVHGISFPLFHNTNG